MRFQLITTDCVEAMAEMDEASVDAIVTDPPYLLRFMAKPWDQNLDHQVWGTQALRVLKPGGHLLAFGGTRTYHRLVCGLEDAGFEIRDCLAWLYGSGFPKSLDVSKAIDKARGDSEATLAVTRWLRDCVRESGMTRDELGAKGGWSVGQLVHWLAGEQSVAPGVPVWDEWLRLKAAVGFGDEMDAEVWRLNGRKGKPGEAWEQREVVGKNPNIERARRSGGNIAFGKGSLNDDVTVPATPDAERWQGWGTALKPAFEPVVLARKPLIGSVASNVLAYGTGALNIDGTRIPLGPNDDPTKMLPDQHGDEPGTFYAQGGRHGEVAELKASGRWPANVVLDEEAARLLDESTGELPRGFASVNSPGLTGGIYGAGRDGAGFAGGFLDTGGASRFFYVAKADTDERNRGLGHLSKQSVHPPSGDDRVWDIPGSKSTHRANNHPTVKPVELMQWLCRLITPPKGLVLDPFCGSGSTGMAALREGFDFIGVEREPDYVEIARARIVGDGPLFNEEVVAEQTNP